MTLLPFLLRTVTAGSVLLSLQSRAATFIWDGGGNGNIGGSANWNPDGAPPNDGSADLVFSGASEFTPNAQVPYSINSLLFSNISSIVAFTVTGEKITLVESGGSPPFIRNETSYSNSFSNIIEFQDEGTVRAQSGNLNFGNTFVTGPSGGGGHTVTLTADSGRTITMNGATGGSGNLRVMGNGTVQFNGVNIVSGAFEVLGTAEVDATIAGPSSITVGGTLRLESSNRIGNAPITVNGNLILDSFQETIGTLSGSGVVSMGTNGDLRVYQNTNSSFTGTLSGAGTSTSFRKEGIGVLTLGGTASYVGTTTVAEGTLRASNAAAIAPFADVAIETGATFDVNGRVISVPTVTGTGTLHLPNVSELSVGGLNGSFAYAGSLTGEGSLTKSGTGTLQLTKSGGSFDGVINLAGGITELRESNVGGLDTRVSVGNGSTLQLIRGKSQSMRGGLLLNGTGAGGIGALKFTNEGSGPAGMSGPVTLAGSSTIVSESTFDVVIGTNGEEMAFGTRNLTLSGTGNFELRNDFTGSGTLNVNGGTSNDVSGNNAAYTGRINVNQGRLILLHDQALGSGIQPVSVADGASISLGNGTDISTERTLALTGALRTESNATCSWSGNGIIEASEDSIFSVGAGSTLSMSGGSITGEDGLYFAVLDGGTLTLSKNAAAGGGEFEKQGGGELILNSPITGMPKLLVADGKLTLGAANRIPDAADLQLSTGGSILALNGFSEKAGGLSGFGDVLLGSGTLTISPSAAASALSHHGEISGSGNVVVDAAVPGRRQTFATANTYTGRTTVQNGAVLDLRAAGALSPSARLAILSGGELQLAAPGQVVGSLAGTGKVVHTSAAGILEVGGESPATIWSGVIEGPGGLTKGGSAEGFIMTATQLHTGPTRVATGSMVSAGLISSDLTIEAGAAVYADGKHADIDCFGLIGNHVAGDIISAESVTLRTGSGLEMVLDSWDTDPIISAESLNRIGGQLRMRGQGLPALSSGQTKIVKVARTEGGVTGSTTGIGVTLLGDLASFAGTAQARVRETDLEVVFTAAGNIDYFDWIEGYDVDSNPDGDPDGDGVSNGIEFLIGGDPASVDDSGLLPRPFLDATHLEFTYRRMKRSLYLNPTVEYSTNLETPWSSAVNGGGGATIVVTPVDVNMDQVTVRIPRGTDPRKFARLRLQIDIPA